MNALAEAYESAVREVGRDPQSARSAESIALTIREIDRFLTSPEMVALGQLEPQRRAAIPALRAFPERLREVLKGLLDMLSVGLQTEELGGHALWKDALAASIKRLEETSTGLGFPVDLSQYSPPIVKRLMPSIEGEEPHLQVAEVIRRPRLESYIEIALRAARVRELEPGHWYADLEAFPGVWVDGSSPEQLLPALAEALHEWLIIKVALGDADYPVFGDLDPRTLVLG